MAKGPDIDALAVRACYLTNVGKVRGHNEDSLLLNDLLVPETSMDKPLCRKDGGTRLLYVVADGMGGHAKGEVASRTVLEVFREEYVGAEGPEDILRIIRKAKQALNSIASGNKSALGLGTTAAGVLLLEKRAVIFSCGDSRVYRLKDGILGRMTKDHSLVQEFVDGGIITEEEARFHPQKNIVTSAVTGDLREAAPEVYIREEEVRAGDILILCTDGLWESLDPDEMEACFSGTELESAVSCLFTKYFGGPARDNVSIIALKIVS